jgi:hypothetical protein
LERRLKNHYKRWNIDLEQREQLDQLKNRILLITDDLIGHFFADDVEADEEFVFALGIDPEIRESYYKIEDLFGSVRAFGCTHVYRAIRKAEDLGRLATVLQVMFMVLEQYESEDHSIEDSLIKELAGRIQDAAKLTPSLGLRIAVRDRSVTFYPAGAELLDQRVVDDVFGWLKDYPSVEKPFERAMKTVMRGDRDNYRSLFDDLRLALEQLLRQVLGNKKSFENQEQPLLAWIKARGVHQQVVNMYKQLLFGPYRIYQNDAVKHGEEYSEGEVEFMIYLTGTFMRLLLQLQAEAA